MTEPSNNNLPLDDSPKKGVDSDGEPSGKRSAKMSSHGDITKNKKFVRLEKELAVATKKRRLLKRKLVWLAKTLKRLRGRSN